MWQPGWTRSWTKLIPISCKRPLRVFICIFKQSNEKNHFSKTKIYFQKKTTSQLLRHIGRQNMKVGEKMNLGDLPLFVWYMLTLALKLNDAIMVFKIINNLAPDYLANKFKLRSCVHDWQTRSASTLDKPFCCLSTGQRSFAYRGAKLCNSLSSNLKCLKCPKKFTFQFT